MFAMIFLVRFRAPISSVHRFCFAGSFILALAIAGGAQDARPGQATPSTSAKTETIPSYPDSEKGLESLVKNMINLEKKGDEEALEPYVSSLALPDAESWFKSVFGDNPGTQFASATKSAREAIETGVANTLSTNIREKRTNIKAIRLTNPCSVEVSPAEYPVLILRKRSDPLYDVHFSGNGSTTSWFYFAYVDGRFRFVGPMRKTDLPRNVEISPPSSTSAGPERTQAGGNFTQPRMIHPVPPEFPRDVTFPGQNVRVKVVFRAVISVDGRLKDLDLLEGQCSFVQPALDALNQWRYQPATLNGHPVEIQTTVSVDFSIGF
jgi:hypothetical protein